MNKIKSIFLIIFVACVISVIFYSSAYAKYQEDVFAGGGTDLGDYVVIELQKNKTYKNIDEFIDAICDIPIKNENNESPIIKSEADMKPYREAAKAYFKYKASKEGYSAKEISQKFRRCMHKHDNFR